MSMSNVIAYTTPSFLNEAGSPCRSVPVLGVGAATNAIGQSSAVLVLFQFCEVHQFLNDDTEITNYLINVSLVSDEPSAVC